MCSIRSWAGAEVGDAAAGNHEPKAVDEVKAEHAAEVAGAAVDEVKAEDAAEVAGAEVAGAEVELVARV